MFQHTCINFKKADQAEDLYEYKLDTSLFYMGYLALIPNLARKSHLSTVSPLISFNLYLFYIS